MTKDETHDSQFQDAVPVNEARSLTWNLDSFVECIRRSGLIVSPQLDDLTAEFRKSSTPQTDPRAFLQLLVEAQLLTRWQAKKILRGKCYGFFIGRYRLLSYLGRGAMGVVFLAEHVKMHRRVALKILMRQFVEDAQRLRMFYHESEVTAALDHPNLVRAYDVDNEGPTHYLVMEYVDGENLFDVVERDGPLLCEKAAEYVRETAEGLAYAHERGIIHRDVKPANIMLDSHGRIKLLDMGLAHFSSVASPFDAKKHRVGTPDYMSPEQAIVGTDIDGRADVYSLGCTLYYLLTGDRPYLGDTAAEVIRGHVHGQTRPFTDFRGDVPEDLAAIVAKMMAKKADDRYPSARALSTALNQWLKKHESLPIPRPLHVPSHGAQRILVADDDELTRQLLKRSLEKHGYHVTLAADGEEAMQLFNPQMGVCLFDLKMPGASGMQCLRFVQEKSPETPVIIISGAGEIRDAVAAMREGAFDYFTKPCKVSGVVDRVADAFEARRRASEHGVEVNRAMTTVGQRSASVLDDFLQNVNQLDDESVIYRNE